MSGDDRQNSPSISRQNRPSATDMYKFEPLTAVVLVDNNMGIGSGSDILFHCRPFREQQMRILANHPVIMGRNTYESFPWEKVPPVLNSRILLLSLIHI